MQGREIVLRRGLVAVDLYYFIAQNHCQKLPSAVLWGRKGYQIALSRHFPQPSRHVPYVMLTIPTHTAIPRLLT